MNQTKYRAQILLEPEPHHGFEEATCNEKRSLSDLVREIECEWLAKRDEAAIRQREQKALGELP